MAENMIPSQKNFLMRQWSPADLGTDLPEWTSTTMDLDLRHADMRHLKVINKSFYKADFFGASLAYSSFKGCRFNHASLGSVNMFGVYAAGCIFRGAIFQQAVCANADFRNADFTNAAFKDVDFSYSNLAGADFTHAALENVNFSGANLSQVKGLMRASDWMEKHFEWSEKHGGYIVYRAQNGHHEHPPDWTFEPGAVLTETPNMDRTTECACGVSFGTLHYIKNWHATRAVWRCVIKAKDLPDVVVPFSYMHDIQKGRCDHLHLIEKLKDGGQVDWPDTMQKILQNEKFRRTQYDLK